MSSDNVLPADEHGSPISRLPPELLCCIFHFSQSACDDGTYEPSSKVSWIVVTHVCQYWRDVALNEPTLWATPPLRLPKWTAEMLLRSKEAPLYVDIKLAVVKKRDAISDVIAQAHRVGQLEIETTHRNEAIDTLFSEWGPLDLPRLEKLRLKAWSSGRYRVPDNLFNGTVNLRHLTLSGVGINWSSSLLRSLTTLVIESVPVPALPSWAQFRDMLRRMPRLESLVLRLGIPSKPPAKGIDLPPSDLPWLKKLYIMDLASRCIPLLPLACSDALQNRKYKLLVGFGEADVDINVCNLLLSPDNRLNVDARTLIIRGYYYDKQYIMTFQTANGVVDIHGGVREFIRAAKTHPGWKLKLVIEESSYAGDFDSPSIFHRFFQASHFSTLSVLDLSKFHIYSRMAKFVDVLAETCGSLPSLSTIIIGERTTPFFVDVLTVYTDRLDDGDDSDPSDPPSTYPHSDEANPAEGEELRTQLTFPALINLKLYNVPFGGGYDKPVSVKALAECLLSRKMHGAEIHLLILEDCLEISSDGVDYLKSCGVARLVEWDGIEDFQANEYEGSRLPGTE